MMTPETLAGWQGKTVLVTCDNWFYGPDGRQYRAAWGTLRGVHTAEDTLGVRPNGRSTNWYLQVGEMVIAGCQVHYVIRAASCNFSYARDYTTEGGKSSEFDRPGVVFNADELAVSHG